MKRFTAVLISLVLLLSAIPFCVYAEDETIIPIYLDGELVDFGTTGGRQDNAVIVYDFAYVPIARIIEILTGTPPDWNNDTRTASFDFNNKSYIIDTTQAGITVDGAFVPSPTETAPVIINNRTLVPLAMLSGVMGFKQVWNEALRSTFLTSPMSQAAIPVTAGFNDITAMELVSGMRAGWNLGNTLDATGTWLDRDTAPISDFETMWGNPVTTRENIDALAAAGFNTIRIPVSWGKMTDSDYNIRDDWMDRVKEVVDYAAANDMYIIINSHHDGNIIKVDSNNLPETMRALKRIWEQIAEAFRDYNEKLIFEGMNEPRVEGSANEWNGGTAEERVNINILNQIFVDTVRKSGGNNAIRALMVPTYAASAAPHAMNDLVIPQDTAKDKIIVSIHAYTPYNFTLNTRSRADTWDPERDADTRDIDDVINRASALFVENGVPVIIGEMGALNKTDNHEARAAWALYYFGQAKAKGIPCIWWDNGVMGPVSSGEAFGIFNRRENVFIDVIIEAIMRGTE